MSSFLLFVCSNNEHAIDSLYGGKLAHLRSGIRKLADSQPTMMQWVPIPGNERTDTLCKVWRRM
uniref:RNase H type-1 domain-containing protein n=1 Tax=Arion vulgaris TaxID=1028688 RepID=A0A0B7AWA2_9EUPU